MKMTQAPVAARMASMFMTKAPIVGRVLIAARHGP
jgi:hypothetical protein